MRITALAGLFAFSAIIAASISTVEAEALDITQIEKSSQIVTIRDDISLNSEDKGAQKATETKPEPPKPIEHLVQAGETLSIISEKHQTTWKRIFDKNTSLSDPDVIKPGEKLIIPFQDEVLAEREVPVDIAGNPAPVIQPKTEHYVQPKAEKHVQPKTVQKPRPSQHVAAQRGSSNGNTYSPGYCTWYAKNKRPDLPNSLGNANTWVSRAASQGLATGSIPKAGAIGQQGMHVVYVERVNSDGTVTISEMNYKGLYTVSTRTVPAGTFLYIY